MYPAGIISDRRGRKIPFVSSLVLIGLTSPLLFFATDLTSFALIIAMYGLALGLHGPLASWASDLVPIEKMGTGMGVYRMIADVGFLAGPLVMGAIMDLTSSPGVRVTFWPFLFGAIWMVTAGLLLITARDPIAERRKARLAAESR
jgi:MFS family permease